MARKPSSKLVDTHFEETSKYHQPTNDRVVQGIQSNRLKMRIEDLSLRLIDENQLI